jgi:hypothetical protein
MRIKTLGVVVAVSLSVGTLAIVAAISAGSSASPRDRSSAAVPNRVTDPPFDRGPAAAPGPNLKACPADGSVNFDSYGAGAVLDNLPLSRTLRVCEPLYTGSPAPPTRINSETKIYGTCKPAEGIESCAYPLTVESWPACERNLALYKRYPAPDGSTIAFKQTSVRGVPAAVFEDGHRIEVYTGDVTVVISSPDPDIANSAARKLTGLHQGKPVEVGADLPAPAPGALSGTLDC